MTDRVTILVEGESDPQQRLGAAVQRLANPVELMDRIGALMFQSTRDP